MYCFPDFVKLSVFSCSLLSFLKTIILSFFHRSPFLAVGYWNIVFLLWCHFSLRFWISCSVSLMCAHLIEQPLFQTLWTGFSGERPSPMGGCKGTSWWDEAVPAPGDVQWCSFCAAVSCHQHQKRLKRSSVAKAVGFCSSHEGWWVFSGECCWSPPDLFFSLGRSHGWEDSSRLWVQLVGTLTVAVSMVFDAQVPMVWPWSQSLEWRHAWSHWSGFHAWGSDDA